MQKEIVAVWQALKWTGTECFTLKPDINGLLAESYLTGRDSKGQPFALAYKIELDTDWRLKRIGVWSLLDVNKRLRLTTDFAGHWFNDQREQLFNLDGCEFADISLTPFTNSLPIKRLKLGPDPSPAETIFIDLPEFQVSRETHFYSKTKEGPVIFKDIYTNVTAELILGQDGLVAEYQGFFKQI